MAGFDPDAYLAQTPTFDPDAYLKGGKPKGPQKQTIYNEDTVYDPVTGVPISSGGYGEGAKGATKAIADVATGVVSAPVAFAAGASRPLSSIGHMAGMQSAKQMGEATTGLTKGLAQVNDSQYLIPGAELAGEIAGTAGVGGVLASGLSKVAPNATRLAEALRTGGFNAGGATGATGLAIRGAGGAATGGAGAALVNPEDAGLGMAIGGALPVVGKGLAAGGSAIGRALRSEDVKIAEKLAAQTGLPKEQIIQAMEMQGPSMLEGYQKTVPQILQDPTLSQLQRNLKTAGVNTLGDAERLQQQQMTGALERVAPIQATPFDAAQRAGGAIQNYAVPARQNATENVRNAFDAVDPFGETALNLPISEMERAAGKFLGEGTFGTGGRAAEAINTAKRVGTEVLPEVKAITQKEAGKQQNLEQAVRALGGMRDTGYLSKELSELGRKQSGTTGLVGKTGKDVEKMAELMHERGFIPDNDPATLLDALRNKGGRNTFASDVSDNAFQRQFEAAMGDMPDKQVISKAVPFQTIQNLRSSIGEAAAQAEAKGAGKEAAALKTMIGEIDSRINRAAGGNVGEGEFFPKDIADQYRKALGMHEAKMKQFETGPQASMFRKGGDGQMSIQGAEIAPKFYNSAMSQADDVKAFKRLIGDRTDLADELKSFAITQADATRNAQGDLGDKYIKWMKGRAGANRELMSPQELATIKEVSKAVQNQMRTESLGRVTGSDTAQKLATMQSNGILDSRMVDVLANKIPVVSSFTGPMLKSLRDSATKGKNETMARLLANPQEFSNALRTPAENKALAEALRMAMPVSRALPVAFTD